MLPPTDGKAIALGFRYVVFGPDIGIPYAASTITTRRSVIAQARAGDRPLHARHGRSFKERCTVIESSFIG